MGHYFFVHPLLHVGSAAIGNLFRRQEGRQLVLSQYGVHIVDVIDPVAERYDECTIPGNPCVQGGHAVEGQRLLHFLQLKLGRQADSQDNVTLQGMLLAGDKFVSVSLRQICSKEYILLQDALLSKCPSHVVCEWSLAKDQL